MFEVKVTVQNISTAATSNIFIWSDYYERNTASKCSPCLQPLSRTVSPYTPRTRTGGKAHILGAEQDIQEIHECCMNCSCTSAPLSPRTTDRSVIIQLGQARPGAGGGWTVTGRSAAAAQRPGGDIMFYNAVNTPPNTGPPRLDSLFSCISVDICFWCWADKLDRFLE